jgi:Co/Zn/Cd efflux system component
MADEHTPTSERRVLALVLALNLALVLGLGSAGVIARSSALLANAADNASDAVVYALSFYAVTRSRRWKTRAARLSGSLLLVLCVGVVAEAARRYFGEETPGGWTMIVMAIIASVTNLACLGILSRHRDDEVNMRAAWTFSINDFASNAGIVIAGGLVAWRDARWPDLVVALAVAALAIHGGFKILADAGKSAAKVG